MLLSDLNDKQGADMSGKNICADDCYSHGGQCGMDGCAPDLYGDDGVESANGGLEGGEEVVLVREEAEVAWLDTKADAEDSRVK